MSKYTIALMSIFMILFSFGFADEIDNQDEWNNVITHQQTNGDIKQTETSLVKLAHYIDLWHNANLKGNKKKIFAYEQDILSVIQFDIRASQSFISFKENEQAKIKHNNKSKYPGWKNLNKLNSILIAKKRLLGSFTRTSSFSNKLRLLGDYQELMRRELDLSRIKLAEDWEELVDDLQEGQQD